MGGLRTTTQKRAPNALVLIEPDANVLDALKRLLQGFGWTVESSAGIGGLCHMLENSEFTAVISEANVPGCTADEVQRACSLHHVPVVFTGHDVSPQAAVDLMQNGAVDFLEKPFPHGRLVDLLNRLRNRHNDRARPLY